MHIVSEQRLRNQTRSQDFTTFIGCVAMGALAFSHEAHAADFMGSIQNLMSAGLNLAKIVSGGFLMKNVVALGMGEPEAKKQCWISAIAILALFGFEGVMDLITRQVR